MVDNEMAPQAQFDIAGWPYAKPIEIGCRKPKVTSVASGFFRLGQACFLLGDSGLGLRQHPLCNASTSSKLPGLS